jgi:hypothetical protein
LILEKFIQIFPANAIYWLGFLIVRSWFVIAEKQIVIQQKSNTRINEEMGNVVHNAIWDFYNSQEHVKPGDERVAIDVNRNLVVFRKLWIVRGIFTGTRYQIGAMSVGVGFVR